MRPNSDRSIARAERLLRHFGGDWFRIRAEIERLEAAKAARAEQANPPPQAAAAN